MKIPVTGYAGQNNVILSTIFGAGLFIGYAVYQGYEIYGRLLWGFEYERKEEGRCDWGRS